LRIEAKLSEMTAPGRLSASSPIGGGSRIVEQVVDDLVGIIAEAKNAA